MPLGLWKSKWEIHREDMREDRARWDAESRDLRRRSDEIRDECREVRADYNHELIETRRFDAELLTRLENTERNIEGALKLLGAEIIAMREDLHELKAAVDAQTEAILRLVDRFEGTDGRPPV